MALGAGAHGDHDNKLKLHLVLWIPERPKFARSSPRNKMRAAAAILRDVLKGSYFLRNMIIITIIY